MLAPSTKPNYQGYRLASLFGVIPKSHQKDKWRLIIDLSPQIAMLMMKSLNHCVSTVDRESFVVKKLHGIIVRCVLVL